MADTKQYNVTVELEGGVEFDIPMTASDPDEAQRTAIDQAWDRVHEMELGTWLSEGKVSIEEVDKLCDQS